MIVREFDPLHVEAEFLASAEVLGVGILGGHSTMARLSRFIGSPLSPAMTRPYL